MSPHAAPADPATTASGTDSLASGMLLLMALTVIQRGVGLLRGVLVCRWLDPEALGQWDMCLGFFLTAAPLAVLGLPGSFGRFVEFYRQRGQLRPFLARVTGLSAVGVAGFMLVMLIGSDFLSRLVFGNVQPGSLAGLLVICLPAVVVGNFTASLLIALRLNRISSGMQLVQSLLFAGGSVALLWGWKPGPESIVLAYTVSLVVSALAAWPWLVRACREAPTSAKPLGHSTIWKATLRFALWVWCSNALFNLFEVVDRYMLLHFAGLDSDTALTQVGQYHSSRLLPVIFVGLADLLATTCLPHFTHRWEAGDRRGVSDRLQLIVKAAGYGFTALGALVLAFGPFVFGVLFGGKYGDGLVVLPWTMTYCIWLGLASIAQTWLWCHDRASLGSLALVLGVVLNVVLNLLWLPSLGLLGAVLATSAANLLALGTILFFAHRRGLPVGAGTIACMLLPAALPLGAGWSIVILALVAALALTTPRLLSAQEREILGRAGARFKEYIPGFRGVPGPAA